MTSKEQFEPGFLEDLIKNTRLNSGENSERIWPDLFHSPFKLFTYRMNNRLRTFQPENEQKFKGNLRSKETLSSKEKA